MKIKEYNLNDPKYFINRELSWMSFNFRVLAEGQSEEVPLLERLKFIAIVSSNLDEFTVVRIANALRADKDNLPSLCPAGLSCNEIVTQLENEKKKLLEEQYKCLQNSLLPALEKENISIIRDTDYTDDDLDYLRGYFQDKIAPALTPMAIDTGHPFPLLASNALYILFRVKSQRQQIGSKLFTNTDTVLVQMPGSMKRFIKLDSNDGTSYRFAVLDDTIRTFASELLGGYEIEGAYAFRIMRDAQMRVDDQAVSDLLGAIDQAVRSRRWGDPISLEITTDTPEPVIHYLCDKLNLDYENGIFHIPYLINLKDLWSLTEIIKRPDLLDTVWPPQPHPDFQKKKNIFAAIKERDHFISLPYQSFDPVIELVEQAAIDPKVLAIKITLYRVSGNSPIVQALINAAENGKQVTVLVELRARFDEEANINWARALDRAGAHVIYGVVGYKTHSKVLMVVRDEHDGINRYVHLATGNYNDKTAKLYTDTGIFTTDPDIGQDASGFFNVITGYSLPPAWKRLIMAPTDLRDSIISLIERECLRHSPQNPGLIRVKMNSLTDVKLIKALYKASQCGVKIQLLIRGMCRLRTGIKGVSENISVTSILDRYLEHPRIIHFSNGGNDEVYMSSADWMERNLDNRLELMYPIDDQQCKNEALKILDAGFKDNAKAWVMNSDSSYSRVKKPAKPDKIYHSQYELFLQATKSNATPTLTPEGAFIAKSNPDAL